MACMCLSFISLLARIPCKHFSAAESAIQQQAEALWRPRCPPIYSQRPSSGPLAAIRGLDTE